MNANGYESHVFVSYSRHGLWKTFVEDDFLPLFHHWLGEELGYTPKIFIDHQLEAGCSWPSSLGDALARSCVLVPLWSKQYFSSIWCTAELAHMHARELSCGLRTDDSRRGLIVPATLHDGEEFPPIARGIQSASFHDCALTQMAKKSPAAEKFEQHIKAWVPAVKRAIKQAPPFDPAWSKLAIQEFIDLFQTSTPRQLTPPLIKAS